MQSSSTGTASPQTGISHSSWLSKRAEWRFAWDRRVVSLQGRLLSYKEGPNKPDKKAGHVTSFQRECSTPLTFRVWVDVGETWTLRADDEETYQRWVGVLMRAVMAEENADAGDLTQSDGNSTALSNQQRDRKCLSASVLKRSYWTHTWRPRYLELGPRGCIIEYSEEEGGSLRGRVNVVAVDPVAPPPSDEGSGGGGVREVAFQAHNGEGFHVRFESEEVAATWIVAFRERLGESRGCRWQALRVQKASGGTGFIMSAASSSRFGHGGTATDAALGRVAHCSFVEKDHLFVFGGRTAAGFSCTDELIGAFNGIPSDTSVTTRSSPGASSSSGGDGGGADDDMPPSQLCSKDLFHVRLSGDFIANPTAVQPFEEAGRAKVRPVEREGAAGCVLGSHWVMQGGRTFTSGSGGVLSDAWSIDLGALSSGVGLGWTRRTDESGAQQVVSSEPQQSTPAIAFHTATPLSGDTMLLCGGTTDGIIATDATWLYNPLSGSVQRGPTMPSARLQHSAVAIPSSSSAGTSITQYVLVVGGSTAVPGIAPTGGSSGAAITSRVALPLMMLLDVVSGVWTSVRLDYPPSVKLPSFTYPSAALLPTTTNTTSANGSSPQHLGRVAIYGGNRSSRKLPILLIADISIGCSGDVDGGRREGASAPDDEDIDISDDIDVDELPESIASNAPYSKRPNPTPIVAKIRPVQALGDSPTYACGVELVVYGGYVYLVGGGGEGGVSLPRLMLNTI